MRFMLVTVLQFSMVYDITGKKQILIGGVFPMSGAWSGGLGCLPATQMALHDVNLDPTILSDYELSLSYYDSMCLPGLGLHRMYELLYDDRTKIVLLTGCSGVSTFIAQAAPKWNLIVLSYGSSSPALSDRSRFPTFFRTHPSATLDNPTRLKLFKKFGWRRIATIQQTEEVFTSTIKDLEEAIRLESHSTEGDRIEIAVRQSFQTDPVTAVKSLKRQDARIIIGLFYEDMARKVFCQAYKEGLYGKQFVWLIIGWYSDQWYAKPDKSIDCTPEELKTALEGHLTSEVVQYNLNEDAVTDTGITTKQFKKRLQAALENVTSENGSSLTSLDGYVEAPLAYDAVWALSFALNKTISDLSSIKKQLEDFTYEDEVIKDAIFANLNQTNFEGVSGRVSFTSTGDRIAKTQIEQMQDGVYKVIGVYNYIDDDLDWKNTDRWVGGIPPADRTVIEDRLRVISPALSYIMISLACLGILLSIAAVVFVCCSRSYSIVANSSPILNLFIVVGCLIALACVPLFSLDGALVTTSQYTSVCQIRTWLIVLGFTTSYGTMFSKILYCWRRAKTLHGVKPTPTLNTSNQQLKNIGEQEPYLILAGLIAIDLIILVAWQVYDPLTRDLHVFELEKPPVGLEKDIMYRPLLEFCSSRRRTVWSGIIYGYKGILLVIGLFLAYETRGIKIGTMNDIRFVSMAVYNVVVLCLIAVPISLIVPHQQNSSFVFRSLAIILSSYLTLGLLFIPKVIPILTRRLSMSEQQVQSSLIMDENEKHYEQLKKKNEALKQEILQKEKEIKDLHALLHEQSQRLVADDTKVSDSAFSEGGSNDEKLYE